MKLEDLSSPQLARVYRKVARSVPDGGHFGWDWPTLRMPYPAKAQILRRVLEILREREVSE